MKNIRTLVIAAIAFCALAVTAQSASAQVAVGIGPVRVVVGGPPIYYEPVNPYPFGICGYDEYGYAIPCAPPAVYSDYPYWVNGYWNGGIWIPGFYRGYGREHWHYNYSYDRHYNGGYRDGGYRGYPGEYRGNPGAYRGNPGAYRGNPGAYRGNPGAYRGNPGAYRGNPGFHSGGGHSGGHGHR